MGVSRRLRAKAGYLCAALLPLAISFAVVGGSTETAAASVVEVHLQGVVHCHGGAVTGIWVADSANGSGWATRYPFSSSDTADNRYGITVPLGTVSFSVGCGGTTSS
jgi:hypothetical protein